MCKLHYFLCAIIFLAFVGNSHAAQPAAPQKVTAGVYVMDIYNLDSRKCTYTMDFYIWFRWQGDVNPRNFEIMNGYLEQKGELDDKVVNGIKYVSYRCRATVHSSFNFRKCPFDTQDLGLQIEDGDKDIQSLVYDPDIQDSKLRSDITIPGRKVGELRCGSTVFDYPTNFGDPSLRSVQKANYSRFFVVVPITRKGLGLYLKMFLILFISVAVAFLTFLVRPSDVDPRFGVGVAGIFGAVSSSIVSSQSFPEIPNFTLADWLHIISMLFIFLSLLQSCITLRLCNHGRQGVARKLDRIALVAFPLIYIFVVAVITYLHR